MKIQCPFCHQQGQTHDNMLGKKVKCPHCDKIFRLTNTALTDKDTSISNVCVSCGFSFSEGFIHQHNSLSYCHVCLPRD